MRSVKFEILYEAVFENRVVRYFTAAAPGLDELTLMGKIENLHRESLDPSKPKAPKFDLMVFDAPATGHALALFKVPRMAMSMARMSPLYSKAERMWNFLADPVRTALNIVTLPEELPVNESIDLHAAAGAMGIPSGKVLVNAVYPDFFPGEHDEVRRLRDAAAAPDTTAARISRAALNRAVASVARREAHLEMIDKIAEALPRPRVVLPLLFRRQMGRAEIETLAGLLESF
jgi:anion-transporting  ArsA/GET3 family ATPase